MDTGGLPSLLETLAQTAQLTPAQLYVCAGVVFLAGVVRGFSGFALSALIMASLTVWIAPVELIPVCYLLEAVASLVMFRGGAREADMRIVWGLVIGSAIGTPLGLLATTTISPDVSRLVALFLVLSLAMMQLFKVRIAWLATNPGLYTSGLAAGVATGLASIGGMVVALYVLAQEKAPRAMRGSLVMYLFFGMFTGWIFHLYFGTLTAVSGYRAAILVPFVVSGVLFGSLLFRPGLEGFYKSFCLLLLVGLALVGLARLAFGG